MPSGEEHSAAKGRSGPRGATHYHFRGTDTSLDTIGMAHFTS